MKIRKAIITDLKTLLDFGEKLHLVEKEFQPLLEYSKQEVETRYVDQLNNPLAIFLIAEDIEDEPGGYLYAHLEGSLCELEVVYIDTHFRKNGLATSMIKECVEWAKEKNVKQIETTIFSENMASIGVFEKLGFELVKDLNNTISLEYKYLLEI